MKTAIISKVKSAHRKAQSIISSGSPSTTGYGNFGSLTRAKINSILSVTAASSPEIAADNNKALQGLVLALQ